MENAVEVRGLRKSYGDYEIKGLDLDIPAGYIVGLIGENGAGKTTLIKCITGANRCDSGIIKVFGSSDRTVLGKIGVVFDECCFHKMMSGKQIGDLMADLYPEWDQSRYEFLMEKFGISLDKKVHELSRGMSMKIQVAVELSHGADLVILDEATAGMDPASRDEFLDIVMEYMQDDRHSMLMSSHITSDLERVADYIVFLHGGRIIMSEPKDEILDRYGVVKGGEAQVLAIGRENIVSLRRESYSVSALVRDRHAVKEAFPELTVDTASLDDIMVLIVRGDAA